MTSGMEALFKVAGIIVISHAGEMVISYLGHGDKSMFLKIATYFACAYVVWDVFWKGVRYVAYTFGVSL
jgi:hypothetical protein